MKKIITEAINTALDSAVIALNYAELLTKSISQEYDNAVNLRNHHINHKTYLTGYPRYIFNECQWSTELDKLEEAIEAAKSNYKKIKGEELKVRMLVEKLEIYAIENAGK